MSIYFTPFTFITKKGSLSESLSKPLVTLHKSQVELVLDS